MTTIIIVTLVGVVVIFVVILYYHAKRNTKYFNHVLNIVPLSFLVIFHLNYLLLFY